MATIPNDVDAIRQRMAEIRRELHEDVRDVVASAEAVTDWQRYIRSYPWVALGAAFGLGYFVVPRRRTHAAEVASAAVEKARETLEKAPRREQAKEKARKSLIGAAWALAAPVAIRAAQSYAAQYLEQMILQQQQQMAAAGPPPVPPGGPGRPR